MRRISRPPEQPAWTLMLTTRGSILAVRQEFEAEKMEYGWVVVARERDVLPFNTPRLIHDDDDQEDGA